MYRNNFLSRVDQNSEYGATNNTPWRLHYSCLPEVAELNQRNRYDDLDSNIIMAKYDFAVRILIFNYEIKY